MIISSTGLSAASPRLAKFKYVPVAGLWGFGVNL